MITSFAAFQSCRTIVIQWAKLKSKVTISWHAVFQITWSIATKSNFRFILTYFNTPRNTLVFHIPVFPITRNAFRKLTRPGVVLFCMRPSLVRQSPAATSPMWISSFHHIHNWTNSCHTHSNVSDITHHPSRLCRVFYLWFDYVRLGKSVLNPPWTRQPLTLCIKIT